MGISAGAIDRFRREIRSRTSRVRRIRASELLSELAVFMRGWAGYFARFPGCRKQLEELDRWVRLRIRQWLWVSWKTTANRLRQLQRSGVSAYLSRIAVGTISPWRAAHGSAMGICVTNARIERAGLPPMMRTWERFAAS